MKVEEQGAGRQAGSSGGEPHLPLQPALGLCQRVPGHCQRVPGHCQRVPGHCWRPSAGICWANHWDVPSAAGG